jgi:hypothetical protein
MASYGMNLRNEEIQNTQAGCLESLKTSEWPSKLSNLLLLIEHFQPLRVPTICGNLIHLRAMSSCFVQWKSLSLVCTRPCAVLGIGLLPPLEEVVRLGIAFTLRTEETLI